MLNLNLDAAERFVKGYPDAFWDGWTMVLFKARPGAEFSPQGMYRNGVWGLATRVDPNSNGAYRFRA